MNFKHQMYDNRISFQFADQAEPERSLSRLLSSSTTSRSPMIQFQFCATHSNPAEPTVALAGHAGTLEARSQAVCFIHVSHLQKFWQLKKQF